ncbi:MAG TPA: serine--tRNA ligase [Alphaproteobacteria bacterium]|nr:serine--tRNA ligase [Alphaproteobacteria bacterium]
MIDVKLLRENPEVVDASQATRGKEPVSAEFKKLDEALRAIKTEIQELQNKRNVVSKQIGIEKSQGNDAAELLAEMAGISPRVKELDEKQREAQKTFDDFIATIPNVLSTDVPAGADEEDNIELRGYLEPTKFDFEPKEHNELGVNLNLIDFEAGQKIAGSRGFWLQGDISRLERAISTLMLELKAEDGYTEVSPPFMVNEECMFGTGQLPKFTEDLYVTTDGKWLIPTSEVPLTNYVRDNIWAESDLPFKFTGLTPCFRAEAGSAGRDVGGILRVHQFQKVEMVQIVHPDESNKTHEEMISSAEKVLQTLELPYRVMQLCSGDTGFGARRTVDLEVWLPGQDAYREIASISNCWDFQARRMKARFKDAEGKVRFLHTLNGSGLAVGRCLLAVMENYQTENGDIVIPEALRPFMRGQEIITKYTK